jgi:hypothetical protein
MRTRFRVPILATILTLVFAAAAFSAPTNKGELLKDERHRLKLMKSDAEVEPRDIQLSNVEVVGHTGIGRRGFNADVWEHEEFAYVGHWGFTDWAAGSKQRFCPDPPQSGVAVIDTRDPENPTVVAKLQNPAGTSAEDVVVYTAEAGPYEGRDIAAAGLQVCGGSRYDRSFPRGIMLWDVTTPSSP